jgi:hypothetical protein
MIHRIHILGASGSGTTTWGRITFRSEIFSIPGMPLPPDVPLSLEQGERSYALCLEDILGE